METTERQLEAMAWRLYSVDPNTGERCKEASELTAWEGNFIDGIVKTLKCHGRPSTKQYIILERIYDRIAWND